MGAIRMVVELAQHMAVWNASANGGQAEIPRAARLMVGDIDPAIEWLDAHPPDPCYKSAHRPSRTWMNEMRQSLGRLLETTVSRDSESALDGLEQMAGAPEVRQTAGIAHEAVRC